MESMSTDRPLEGMKEADYGAVLGAWVGAYGIPEHMKKALLSCNTSHGRACPEFLQTRINLPGLIDELIGGEI